MSDYESDHIDLTDVKVYRDLSLRIGAQNANRRIIIQEKYQTMQELREQTLQNHEDGPIDVLSPPPRHYATHYSNSTLVIWWLVRLEPFTSLHVFVQDGRFDRPDRQFHSIAAAWKGSTENDGDVKEVTPEFYTLPQMYANSNQYLSHSHLIRSLNLGRLQSNNQLLSDVTLPPWAHSPEEFVRIQCEALESDYVSKNLHLWIDLIFGSKQVMIDQSLYSRLVQRPNVTSTCIIISLISILPSTLNFGLKILLCLLRLLLCLITLVRFLLQLHLSLIVLRRC